MTAVQIIHIIDDDVMIRFSLQALLGAEGYVVRTHELAQAFLSTLQNGDFGCIVTDLNMPQMSGIELLCEMRKRHSGMPAIVISGTHGPSAQPSERGTGRVSLLPKAGRFRRPACRYPRGVGSHLWRKSKLGLFRLAAAVSESLNPIT